MIEVELKYRLHEPEELLTRLIARGAAPGPVTVQVDLYFDHPLRRFAESDEALRVRWDEGAGLALTYKGPRLDPKSKSREEIEIGLTGDVSTSEQAGTLLERLGFRPVRRVSKRRTTFQLSADGRKIDVSIDDVEELGLFVELEMICDEQGWMVGREFVERTASSLGLGPEQAERRSYLELVMQAESAHGAAH
jgi:adenylate cyclase class 2